MSIDRRDGVAVARAAAALMDAEGEAVEEGLGAELAAVRVLAAVVEAAVQLEVDVLGELGVTQLALERLLPRVEAEVCFQVAGAAEAFVAHLEREQTDRSECERHPYGSLAARKPA